jgi:hypothetical protein
MLTTAYSTTKSTKRFSRLTLKYQNGAAGNDANANGEEGVKMEDAPETNESPSKKTPKKANRGGKGIVRIEKDTIAPITAPRAAGVGKKRSPAKPKANASTTISAFATVAALDGLSLKMGNGAQGGDDEEAGDFVPSFFDEQMDRGVDGE